MESTAVSPKASSTDVLGILNSVLRKLALAGGVMFAYLLARFAIALHKLNKAYKALKVPGPEGHWLLGSIGEMRELAQLETSKVGRFKAFMQLRKRYGDLVKVRFADKNYVLAYDPKMLKSMGKFPKSENYEKVAVILGKGLLTLNGQTWKNHRSMLSHGFTYNEFNKYFPHFTHHTNKLMARLGENMKKGDYINFTQLVTCCTLDIISRTGFGFDMNSLDGENLEAQRVFNEMLGMLSNPLVNFGGKLGAIFIMWYKRNEIKTIDNVLFKTIDQRMNETPENRMHRQPDLLDLLVEAEENGVKFTRREMRDESFIFFLAGHETTALTLQWTMILLIKHPDVLAKLVDEVDRICPGGRQIEFQDINKLTYMKMVLQEVLRLYPPAPMVSRQVPEEIVIDGTRITKDFGVLIPILSLHRDPEVWGEDVNEFNPDKHFAEEAVAKRDPMYYIPFSYGPRQCIGQHFFWVEARVILTTLLQNFKDFELDDDSLPDIAIGRGTAHPDREVKFRMKSRNP